MVRKIIKKLIVEAVGHEDGEIQKAFGYTIPRFENRKPWLKGKRPVVSSSCEILYAERMEASGVKRAGRLDFPHKDKEGEPIAEKKMRGRIKDFNT